MTTRTTGTSRGIDGKGRTVRELLAHNKYSIDYYQREYKWQTKQISELLDDLADKFLDLYLDPDVQYEHSRATGVMPINPDAVKRLSTDPENKDVLLFDPKEIENLYVVDFNKVNLARWRTAWNKDVSRS